MVSYGWMQGNAQEPKQGNPVAPVEGGATSPKTPLKVQSNVTIEFRVEPRWVKAHVYHGKKLLGKTPLKVDRKYNSGPIDVWVKAGGFIPVNTRAYTFKDDKIIVQLTPENEAHTLFGYKAPLVAEEETPSGSAVAPPSTPTSTEGETAPSP